MKKTVQPLHKTRIRSFEPKDFAFVRSLAAEFSTFTIPSEYILWFLMRFHPEYCRVLEEESGELKAYLLAMPTSEPPDGIAIWQVAAATPNQPFALEYFSAYLSDLVERTHAKSISFTASRDSASMRLIRALARQFFDSEAAQLNPVPTGQGEHEFRLSISQPSSGSEKKAADEG
jgi:hypothetical protein